METIPILLDTDIGSDVDDALALAYLLQQPHCELVGITSVTGEADKRAALADALCRAAGRDTVPIHVGTPSPLLVDARQPRAPQAEALENGLWPHRGFGTENTAVAFLRDCIRARPGELTLLAIGPFTNIALLFALAPDTPRLLKQLVIMGGEFFGGDARRGFAEWNILNDPHAAAMVFHAPIPLVAYGLDVTRRCALPAAAFGARLAGARGPLALAGEMAAIWLRDAPQVTFHDPLAAACVFHPHLCQTQLHRVDVELVSPHALGQTLLFPVSADIPAHQVACDVDADAFFAHYFAVVGG